MKVLLFTTNTNYSDCPPLGQFMISAYARREYPNIEAEFSIYSFKSFDKIGIMKLIADENPDLIGIGCYVWNYELIPFLCKKIKARHPKVRIVLGGPSISLKDEKLIELLNCGIIDYSIIGEGEKTFGELLNYLHCGCIGPIAGIPGLMGKDEKGVVFRNERPKEYLVDLNTLPNPYLVEPRLLEQARKDNLVYIETSRGCPYNCGYCVAAGLTFNYKKLDLVIEEIKKISELGLKRIAVLDGTLNFNIPRTKELLNRIIELDLGLDLQFEIKAETLDDELIALLKRAGALFIEIGLQTSNESTLKKIKRYYDKEKFVTNLGKLSKVDIQFLVDLIIGLPDETIDDWFNSIDFCYNLGNIKIGGIVLKLLPNTLLFDEREKYGYEFDRIRMNRVTRSNTMPPEMIDLAESMARVLSELWSNPGIEGLRPYIRSICERYYNNKLSSFLKDISDYIKNENTLVKLSDLSLDEKREFVDYFIQEKFIR